MVKLVFFDTETRSLAEAPYNDVTKCGTARYFAEGAVAHIITYAIDDGPVEAIWAFDGLTTDDIPDELWEAYWDAVEGADVRFVAHNAPFDRHSLGSIDGMQVLPPDAALCTMVQGVASGLPPSLEGAAKACGHTLKDKEGKRLIKLFASDTGATPETHPEDWADYLHYAVTDTEAMRDVYKSTRPLPEREWQEYFASERINDRGVAFDLDFAEAAAELAVVNKARASAEVRALTGGLVEGVTKTLALTAHVYDALGDAGHPRAQDMLVKKWHKEEDGSATPDKLSLERERLEKVQAYFETAKKQYLLSDEDQRIVKLLDARHWSSGAAASKFAKMLLQHAGGRLYHNFNFNGGAQTGRFSGKGAQLQNLGRATVGDKDDELDAIEMIMNAPAFDDQFYKGFEDRFESVGKSIGRLVRPTLIPSSEDRTFVWADYSSIEARVLPWLSASEGGDKKLKAIRETDADPDAPDMYMRAAAGIFEKSAADITKEERAVGKVAELALGFAGGVGALNAMAAGYGMDLDPAFAKEIVDKWRASNQWAVDFWRALEEGFHKAKRRPGEVIPVGRLAYLYDPTYLGGTMLNAMPCGRILTYRSVRERNVDEEDDFGNVTTSRHLTCMKGYGVKKLWKGILVENPVQGFAASLLRDSLVRLGDEDVQLHIHDEIVLETDNGDVEAAGNRLREAMLWPRDWAEGLPLQADISSGCFYSKNG